MAMRVYVGPKDYDDLKAMHPPLNSLVQFGWLEIHRRPAVPRVEVAPQLHSQLGLGHRRADRCDQHAAVPAAHFQLQDHA